MPTSANPTISSAKALKVSARASAASTVRRRVNSGGPRFWKHSDFSKLPASAVATALSRLCLDGEIQRVGKGVYYRPAQTAFGMSIPSKSDIAAQTLRAPVHPAGLSAANALGLTTQNPMKVEYATSASAPPRALRGSVVHVGRPHARASLTPTEGALLEVLRDRAKWSDLSPADTAARLRRLVSDEAVYSRLTQAALVEPPRVRAMLGALGEDLGLPERLTSRLRATLNPLSRFDFGALSVINNAASWQAK